MCVLGRARLLLVSLAALRHAVVDDHSYGFIRCASYRSPSDVLFSPLYLQAEHLLTSSQQLLSKNDYVAAADAVASAESLLLDLKQAEANGHKASDRNPRVRGGIGKENRRQPAGTPPTCLEPVPAPVMACLRCEMLVGRKTKQSRRFLEGVGGERREAIWWTHGGKNLEVGWNDPCGLLSPYASALGRPPRFRLGRFS